MGLHLWRKTLGPEADVNFDFPWGNQASNRPPGRVAMPALDRYT